MADATPDSQYGFTLFEILIGIGIIGVIMAFASVRYNNYIKRQLIIQQGLTLKDALRNIQTKATVGEKPIGIPCTRLIGWEISFTQTSYRSVAKCDPDAPDAPVITTQIHPLLKFDPVPDPILFGVLNRGIGSSATITLATRFDTSTYVLTVSAIGDVTIEGF